MIAGSSATVFRVSDIARAKKYYVDILGFEIDFEFDNYVGVKTGNAFIHLAQVGPDSKTIGKGSTYIFCDEVENYFQKIVSKGSSTRGEPVKAPYGMLDFQAIDPDGNLVAFGCAA